MESLYDVVKRVLDAFDMDEAYEELYGPNGIDISDSKYYNNVVSNFIKKKEYIIDKKGDNLVFNINNENDIWVCVFISEYIRDEINKLEIKINEKISECDNDMSNLIRRCRSGEFDNAELRRLQRPIVSEKQRNIRLLRDLNKCKDRFFNISESINVDFNKNINLSEEKLNTIKEDIKAFHILRNCIEHGSAEVSKELKVKNSNIDVLIPIEYIDGFNKGRIIAREDDKVIFERTSIIVSPLLEELGYNVKKVKSFFYNIDPDWLNFLLEVLDYDYDKLFKLPVIAFNKSDKTYDAIVAFYKQGYDLTKISDAAIYNYENALRLINAGIDISKLKNFISGGAFAYPDGAIELAKAGIDINSLGVEVFKHYENALKLVDAGIDITNIPNYYFPYADNVIFLKNKGLNIEKLPDDAIYYPNNIIKLMELGVDVENLSSSIITFATPEKFSKFKNAGIDTSKLPFYAFMYADNTIRLNNTGVELNKLNGGAFEFCDNALRLIDAGIDITGLPNDAFVFADNTIKIYNAGIDIKSDLPSFAFMYADNAIKLRDLGIDLSAKYANVFGGVFKDFDVLEKIINAGVNLNKLDRLSFDYLDGVYDLLQLGVDVEKLPFEAFMFTDNVIKLINVGLDIEKLPYESFRYSDNVIELKNAGLNVEKLPLFAFSNPKKTLELINSGIDISKIPNDLFYDSVFKTAKSEYNSVKSDNINYCLNLIDEDYNRLDEFPIDFFTCDTELLGEKIMRYNSNVAKSIFGIDNPKIIAILIYCDNVFRNYQKDRGDSNIVDLDPMSVINSGLINTYKYRKNIKDVNLTYLNQFLDDKDGTNRSIEEIKSFILDKLRNSSCHFRFKPVFDNDGNMVLDKIHLYDMYNESKVSNFNIIIDVKDLLEIAKKVEDSLNDEYSQSNSRTR